MEAPRDHTEQSRQVSRQLRVWGERSGCRRARPLHESGREAPTTLAPTDPPAVWRGAELPGELNPEAAEREHLGLVGEGMRWEPQLRLHREAMNPRIGRPGPEVPHDTVPIGARASTVGSAKACVWQARVCGHNSCAMANAAIRRWARSHVRIGAVASMRSVVTT